MQGKGYRGDQFLGALPLPGSLDTLSYGSSRTWKCHLNDSYRSEILEKEKKDLASWTSFSGRVNASLSTVPSSTVTLWSFITRSR